MDIKSILLMIYPIKTISHQLGVNLSCIVAFHMLKTMFFIINYKNHENKPWNSVFLKITF